MKKISRADVILLTVLILMGAALGCFILLRSSRGAEVEVNVSGRTVERFSLEEDRRYTIEGADSGINELIIENGEAYLQSADCPDRLCVHMGRISKNGQSIICLPNEVVVTVRDNASEEDDSMDAVAGGRQ